MSSFLKIANKSNGEIFPKENDLESISKLKEEIARLQESNRYQEAKIAYLNSRLENNKQTSYTALPDGVPGDSDPQIKLRFTEVLARAKQALQEYENRHREDKQKIATLEQQKEKMTQLLHKATEKIASLERALNLAKEKIKEQVGPIHAQTSSLVMEKQPVAQNLELQEAVTGSDDEDLTPLGYSPMNQDIYLRGNNSNNFRYERRFNLLEEKIDKLTQAFINIQKQTPTSHPHQDTPEQKSLSVDSNAGYAEFLHTYEELQNILAKPISANI